MEFFILFLGWILLFFCKKLVYALLVSVFQFIVRPIDLIGRKLDSISLSIKNYSFPRLFLNFILVSFSFFLLVSEYGTLFTSMTTYFNDADLDLFPEVKIASAVSLSYIFITLILGILGLELIGMRKIFKGILFEEMEHDEELNTWKKFILQFQKPIFVFKLIIGSALIGSLFLFADLQGAMSVEREALINDGSNSHISKRLFYLLGFYIPLLASITFLSLEIFLSTIAKIVFILSVLTQKLISITYDSTKRTIELTTAPIELVLDKIDIATKGKVKKFTQPIDINSITGRSNQILMYKYHNLDNSDENNLAKHLTEKIDTKVNDEFEEIIDDIF